MRIMRWILIFVLFVTIIHPAPGASKSAVPDKITEITMNHTPGDPVLSPGQHVPDHKVTFYRNVSAVYYGSFDDPRAGTYYGKIGKADFELLTRALLKMDYLRFPDDYPIPLDAPLCSFVIIHNGKLKKITHGYVGSYPPDKAVDRQIKSLVAFERLIDTTIKHIHWVKVSPKKKP